MTTEKTISEKRMELIEQYVGLSANSMAEQFIGMNIPDSWFDDDHDSSSPEPRCCALKERLSALLDALVYGVRMEEASRWSTGLCSAHQIAEPECGVCNPNR